MKKIFAFFLISIFTTVGFAQNPLLKKAEGLMNPGKSVTEAEAGDGIKEALSNGVVSAIGFLNKTDGFYGSEAYKLFLPDDAVKIANTLRNIGMGKLVDDAVLQINRSAEDAVGFAKPIFVDAIKQMTITDAFNIVKGPKNSGTAYFKQKTTSQLKAAFLPIIQSSLEKTGATKHYSDLVTSYNKLPTTFKKVNPDLPDYVADRAIIALFDQIAVEEANIRTNPLARTSDLLKKVFGGGAK